MSFSLCLLIGQHAHQIVDQARLYRVGLPFCGKSHLFPNEFSLVCLQAGFSWNSFDRRIHLWRECVLPEVDFGHGYALPLRIILVGVQHVLLGREIICFKFSDFSRMQLVKLKYSITFILRFVDLLVRRDLRIDLVIRKECKGLAGHKFLVQVHLSDLALILPLNDSYHLMRLLVSNLRIDKY